MSAAPAAEAPSPKAALIRVDDVKFHPHNVRRDLGDLREMVNSISRYGVMQPIVVERHREALRLRAGHRRLAAARLAGLARVPAFIHTHALTEDQWIMQALHENVMRRNLEPMERADAIKRLRTLGCTWNDIADSLGISVTTAQKWATGQTVLNVAESPAPYAPVMRRGTGTTPATRAVDSKTVTVRGLRKFVDAWSQVPDVTVEQIIAALQVITHGGRPSDAMPSTDRKEPAA